MVKELYKDYSALGRDAKAEVLGAGIFDTLDKNLKYGSLKAESVAYTGKEATPSVMVTSLTGKTLTKDKDYTASCSENINVGKEAVVTVTGMGSYSGSISGTFEITKGTNTLSGTGTYTKIGKVGSAQSFKLNAAAVFGGTITYGSNSSYVTVKAGTVTIKKNFTGVAKLTLKSASSGNYNAASKIITVNVKPGKMAVKSAKNVKNKKLKITWIKMTGADKYQVRVAYNSKMTKGRKTYTVKNSASTKTTGKLRKGKTYYVQIRVYDSQTKAWSAWSAKKKCKVRK